MRTLIGQQTFTLVSVGEAQALGIPFDATRVEFSFTPGPATLEVIADWTFSTSDIDLEISRPPCTFPEFYADTCSKVGESLSATQKPERLTIPNVAAGSYVLYVYGGGASRESGTLQLYATR